MADLNRNGIDDLLEQYLDPWGFSRPAGWYGEWPVASAVTPATSVAPSTPSATVGASQMGDLSQLSPEQRARVEAYMELLNNGYSVGDYVNPTGYTGVQPDFPMASRPPSVRYQSAVQPAANAPQAPAAPVARNPLLDGWLDPWSYSKPRGWEYTGLDWPSSVPAEPAAPQTGYSYSGVDPAAMKKLLASATSGAAPDSPATPATTSGTAISPTNVANEFEKRAAAANISDAVKQQTLGGAGTDGMTTEEYMNMVVDAFLNGNGNNNNGGGGTVQRVLSPEQVQSLVDTLGAQTAMAGQGVGQAYRQADKEMARLMRQYSQAEKMNRAGAQGTLTAFGVRPNAYKVGDFGAPEMLAGARADLIGNKAAEMANWQNQKALYQQLLKDMGG